MPSCCIRNCKSRTYYTDRKGITFYRFPNEDSIRQEWINACQRSEGSIKIDSARVCSFHFDDDCFITQWTQSAKVAKEMRRLKVGSIPTKMLILEKKRKERMSDSDMTITNKRIKVLGRTGIPSYSDLLQCNEREENGACGTDEREEGVCARNETEVKEISERNEREGKGERKDEEACPITDKRKDHNCVIKQDINQDIGNDENVLSNTLLELLIRSEEKNKKLLKENKELLKTNQQLSIQVEKLETSVTQNALIVDKMEKDTRKEVDTAINALQKILLEL